MSRVQQLVPYRSAPVIGPLVTKVMALLGAHIPAEVVIGSDFSLPHRDGIMMDPRVIIGDRVTIFHQVTLGGRDVGFHPDGSSSFERLVLEDDVIVYPGAKVLGGRGTTVLRRGTVVGANAVVTRSTGENEIWVGAPARCIGTRDGRRSGAAAEPVRAESA